MARTYTEQALHIVERMQVIAKRDHTISRSRGLQFHESGYIFLNDERIGIKKEVTWDSLNESTRAYFFELVKEISLSNVQPKIGLKNAPRLSNLKRAGLIIKVEGEKKSQWALEVTPAGKEVLHRA